MARRTLSWVRVGNLILEADDPRLMRWEGEDLINNTPALNQKAKDLLFEFLTPAQQRDVQDHGWFRVKGPLTGKEYCIFLDGQLYELGEFRGDKAFNHHIRLGVPPDRMLTKHWCIIAPGFPKADAALAKMLLLVTDEKEFLNIAI